MANDKDPVFCAADIIKRAKLAKEFKTDSELAAFLGISRSTLSNWNARNSIDFPLLLACLLGSPLVDGVARSTPWGGL